MGKMQIAFLNIKNYNKKTVTLQRDQCSGQNKNICVCVRWPQHLPASEVTTLLHYTNAFIIVIIIITFLDPR